MSKQVLVIGELNVDMILNHIDGFPEIGKEILSSDLHLTLGSSSAIFASNLSAQGTEVSFLGMIGNDQFGTLVTDTFKSNKVHTDKIIRSDRYKTGVTLVMNYDMDRAMVTYPGAMNHLSLEHIKAINLSAFDHVHISSVFLQPLIKRDIVSILQLCKDAELTTSLDPQWDPAEKWDLDLENVLPLTDIFLPNIKELAGLTGEKDLTKALAKLNGNYNMIAVKRGESGASLFQKNKQPISKAAYLNESVIDCIGAGDSFDSGFIYGFINGHLPADCLNRGNIMGAVNTTAPGGTAAFQDRKALKTIIEKQYNYNI